ncbi:helix-turn-helix transcriptional regulator [Coprothermobacteraceae bacterium]|nr:helix-turn-helix transcriptional regulator [Coprothermobacteraceae bacterium]
MRVDSKKLKLLSLEKGLSLYRLALEAGIDPSHLYRILSGTRGAGASTLFKLSKVLGCSPLDLAKDI